MAGGKGRRVKTFKALLPVNSQSEVLYINKEDVVLLGKGDGVPVDVGSGHTSSVLIIPGNNTCNQLTETVTFLQNLPPGGSGRTGPLASHNPLKYQ